MEEKAHAVVEFLDPNTPVARDIMRPAIPVSDKVVETTGEGFDAVESRSAIGADESHPDDMTGDLHGGGIVIDLSDPRGESPVAPIEIPEVDHDLSTPKPEIEPMGTEKKPGSFIPLSTILDVRGLRHGHYLCL